jgi:hypothetical protein
LFRGLYYYPYYNQGLYYYPYYYNNLLYYYPSYPTDQCFCEDENLNYRVCVEKDHCGVCAPRYTCNNCNDNYNQNCYNIF